MWGTKGLVRCSMTSIWGDAPVKSLMSLWRPSTQTSMSIVILGEDIEVPIISLRRTSRHASWMGAF